MNTDTANLISFLKGLRRESGAYADTSGGDGDLRSTLSVLKAFVELGEPQSDSETVRFVRSCRFENGSFSAQPQGEPSPFVTAAGLIALVTLQQDGLLAQTIPAATDYMRSAATTQYDHFMLIAAYEECAIAEPVPRVSIDFFNRQLGQSLAEGNMLDTAIAAASLIRAGQSLEDPDSVVECILSGQDTLEGGFGPDSTSTLFATYCAMRTLVLLGTSPNTQRLSSYLASLRSGYGYAENPGGPTSAGATYQVLSIQRWLPELQKNPVSAARRGDTATLRAWLRGGGDPNLYDSEGWTVLLAAAARGQSEAVALLLSDEIAGAPQANLELRYRAADALPVYMAGQAGDLETVKLLLGAEPKHLHAISAVNGHTVLLQAAFYGKEKHLKLVEYLLDNAAVISRLPAEQQAEEQARLLSATNVRGYSALTMQDLWHNQQMKNLLLRYHAGGNGERASYLEEKRQQYYADLMLAIATPQALTESILVAIGDYLEDNDAPAAKRLVDRLLQQPRFEINRLGGALGQPPLVFALTGVDVGNPARGQRRRRLVKILLDAGADPAVREKHPMGVGAVIRASVLNNFGLLQLVATYMTPEAFAREMNHSPAVNGLTAMHDAIHRALTSPESELEGHLAQITWMIERGARLDIPDNTGQTQRQLAEAAQVDPAFPPANARAVLNTINSARP